MFYFFFSCLPESPRWLLAVGRHTEAIDILQKAAKFNKKNPREIEDIMTELSNDTSGGENKASFLVLFSTPQLRLRSILLFMNWYVHEIKIIIITSQLHFFL